MKVNWEYLKNDLSDTVSLDIYVREKYIERNIIWIKTSCYIADTISFLVFKRITENEE